MKEFNIKKRLMLPLKEKDVLSLHAGDFVLLTGLIVTGRDKLHKFLVKEKPSRKEIPFDLQGSVLYHCGPVVRKKANNYEIIACGPTTSIRVDMYEPEVIFRYGFKGIMGKGGMGEQTLNALKVNHCVYFHAIGGAAVYLAERIKRVVGVWKLEEFGIAEAMWALEIDNFPAIVTMDSYGKNLHNTIEKKSYEELRKLIKL
ncbi:MAG: fumarate hydratase C-terminal domain-containing protein [Nitrospirae bacterium]|jgi:tartrate/fumarate subfamily iron-sulfur-dependent hydro-lyase beta chain|nr:fumarate hydratase C-terminal domain-containing protein [Nitrospirota bacterium]